MTTGDIFSTPGVARVFAFDHEHQIGDVCSCANCEYARRAPVLTGGEEVDDVPMVIVRKATPQEYLNQPIPDGWCIPPLEYGCDYLYEVQIQTGCQS